MSTTAMPVGKEVLLCPRQNRNRRRFDGTGLGAGWTSFGYDPESLGRRNLESPEVPRNRHPTWLDNSIPAPSRHFLAQNRARFSICTRIFRRIHSKSVSTCIHPSRPVFWIYGDRMDILLNGVDLLAKS